MKMDNRMKCKIFLAIVFAVSLWSCEKNYSTETEIGRMEASDLIYLGDEYVEAYFINPEFVNPELELVEKGVCYSEKSTMPTINDNVSYIPFCSYDGTAIVKLAHVKEGIKYYCRVFIQKEDAVVYGKLFHFTMVRNHKGWAQKANFSGKSSSAVGFSIGNKGYVCAESLGEFWEYSPASNIWTRKANLPAGNIAAAFSIKNRGYIVLNKENNNFWEYNPATHRWTEKANFEGESRTNATGFSIGEKGYFGLGNNFGKEFLLYQDFWQYDPNSNKWTQKADFGGEVRYSAVGFSIKEKGYIGTGSNSTVLYKKDFWEYDPVSDTWTQKADFAGGPRVWAAGFSLEDKGFIGTGLSAPGVNNLRKDFWEYNPVTNQWIQKEDYKGSARIYSVAFSTINKGYVGLGGTFDYSMQDFWEFTP